MHDVFLIPKNPDKDYNFNREEYVLQSKIEDNKRVLTVRTQYVLVNKTNQVYKMRQFFVNRIVDSAGKAKKEVMIYNEATLLPGDAFPLPDDKSVDINSKLKITMKPIDCKKWSDELKIPALKEKLQTNLNILWCHYKTYSILRKEKVSDKGVYNLLILPPLIIKNCLPIPISIKLQLDIKTEEEMKQNMRTENRHLSKQE